MHGAYGVPEGLSPLLAAQRDAAADFAGRAFLSDPLYLALEADPAARATLCREVSRLFCRYCLRYGLAFRAPAAPAEPEALLLALPPEEYDLSLPKLLRSGAARLLARVGARRLMRLRPVERTADRAHAENVRGPHWYLLFLAVAPERQGRGLASSLLRPFLDAHDRAGEAVYLDTQNPDNVRLYRRYGFTLISERPVPELGELIHYSMLRPPRSSALSETRNS